MKGRKLRTGFGATMRDNGPCLAPGWAPWPGKVHALARLHTIRLNLSR